MSTHLKIIAIVLAVALATVGVAYASYVMSSNIVNVPVTSQATLSLAVNGTLSFSAVQYDNLTLTATCSDGAYTGTVSFFDGASLIGTAPATAGVARFTFNVTTVKTYALSAQANHN